MTAPLTPAERQGRYRHRPGYARMDVVISRRSLTTLHKLAAHRGATLRTTVEALIAEADAATQAAMNPGEQWHYSQGGVRRQQQQLAIKRRNRDG